MLGSEGGENRVQNWPKTNLSTPGFCNFFSLPLSLSAVPATDQGRHQLHHKKPTQRPTNHQAAIAALSLLLPAFLSPLQLFLLPPTADSDHHHLSRRLLSNRPNHLVTPETPTPGNFLLPASPRSSSSWLLHAEFIYACSG
jgi:hypothetical protein